MHSTLHDYWIVEGLLAQFLPRARHNSAIVASFLINGFRHNSANVASFLINGAWDRLSLFGQ